MNDDILNNRNGGGWQTVDH